MGCALCETSETTSVYLLIQHSQQKISSRRKLMHTESIEHSIIEPHALDLCTVCLSSRLARRKLIERARIAAAMGLVAAMGYFIGAFVQAPTVVVLSLLFGGFSLFAIGCVVVILGARSLVHSLPIPQMPGTEVLVLSTDRAVLDRELSRRKLATLEIRNELVRGDAAELPIAKLHQRDRDP